MINESTIVEVDDEEWILKHVPPGDVNQGKTIPFRVTSANFELRDNETGSSISRLAITSPPELLSYLKCRIGSRVGWTQAKTIRALGFAVCKEPLPYDTGHAEIRSDAMSLERHGDRKRLSKLFEWYETPSFPIEVVESDHSKVLWLIEE